MAESQVSGGDIYTKKIIEYSGFQFDVILSQNAKVLLSGRGLNEVFVTDRRTARSSVSLIFLYAKRIRKSLDIIKKRAKPYDILIASSPFMHDILPVALTPSKNRIVVLYHIIPKRKASSLSTWFRFALARAEQKIALIIIKKFFNSIMAGNEEVKKDLAKMFPDKKIVIAHAGLDTKKIDNVLGVKKDPNLALFVGRLTIQKGILDLVDIMRSVSMKYPDLTLQIVGEGPDKALLASEIQKNKLNNIKLSGFVDEDEKYRLMKKAKFFFFPSKEEGWGIALAEAMYSGCTCICYDLPHYRGIFSNYPNYVELSDKDAFANMVGMATCNTVAQKRFVKQYDDRLIIKNTIKNVI